MGRVGRDAALVRAWSSLELEDGKSEKQGGQVGLLQGEFTKQPTPCPSSIPRADNPLQSVWPFSGVHIRSRAKLPASQIHSARPGTWPLRYLECEGWTGLKPILTTTRNPSICLSQRKCKGRAPRFLKDNFNCCKFGNGCKNGFKLFITYLYEQSFSSIVTIKNLKRSLKKI